MLLLLRGKLVREELQDESLLLHKQILSAWVRSVHRLCQRKPSEGQCQRRGRTRPGTWRQLGQRMLSG
jgi:hypothetical protein